MLQKKVYIFDCSASIENIGAFGRGEWCLEASDSIDAAIKIHDILSDTLIQKYPEAKITVVQKDILCV